MAARARAAYDYTERLEVLSARRVVLTRKLEAARTELVRISGVVIDEREGVEGCTECMRDLRKVRGASDRCTRKLFALRRKLEAVVDEFEWMARKFRNVDIGDKYEEEEEDIEG